MTTYYDTEKKLYYCTSVSSWSTFCNGNVFNILRTKHKDNAGFSLLQGTGMRQRVADILGGDAYKSYILCNRATANILRLNSTFNGAYRRVDYDIGPYRYTIFTKDRRIIADSRETMREDEVGPVDVTLLSDSYSLDGVPSSCEKRFRKYDKALEEGAEVLDNCLIKIKRKEDIPNDDTNFNGIQSSALYDEEAGLIDPLCSYGYAYLHKRNPIRLLTNIECKRTHYTDPTYKHVWGGMGWTYSRSLDFLWATSEDHMLQGYLEHVGRKFDDPKMPIYNSFGMDNTEVPNNVPAYWVCDNLYASMDEEGSERPYTATFINLALEDNLNGVYSRKLSDGRDIYYTVVPYMAGNPGHENHPTWVMVVSLHPIKETIRD